MGRLSDALAGYEERVDILCRVAGTMRQTHHCAANDIHFSEDLDLPELVVQQVEQTFDVLF